MRGHENIQTITRKIIAQIKEKERNDRIIKSVKTILSEKNDSKIISILKRFIKIPSKQEALKIIQKSSDKEIAESFKLLPNVLSNKFEDKRSFNLKEFSKKFLILAAIAVIGGGFLASCGKGPAPLKSDIIKTVSVDNHVDFPYDIKEENFAIKKIDFKYDGKIYSLSEDPTVLEDGQPLSSGDVFDELTKSGDILKNISDLGNVEFKKVYFDYNSPKDKSDYNDISLTKEQLAKESEPQKDLDQVEFNSVVFFMDNLIKKEIK